MVANEEAAFCALNIKSSIDIDNMDEESLDEGLLPRSYLEEWNFFWFSKETTLLGRTSFVRNPETQLDLLPTSIASTSRLLRNKDIVFGELHCIIVKNVD